MKPEKLFNKAQAHVMRNWKMYATVGVLLLLWVNRDSIGESLGLNRKPKPMPDDDKNAIAARGQTEGKVEDLQGNISTVQYSQAVQNFSWNLKTYYEESYTIVPGVDAERCSIAEKIVAMPDNELIVQNAHYLQTYSKSIYQAMQNITTDPCGYWNWSGPSAYDQAVEKLQRVTKSLK